MIGGEFATARRGIDPATLRMAHGIVQRSGYQAAEAATGISKIDLQRHLLPPPPRPVFTIPITPPAPIRRAEPLRFVNPNEPRERAADVIAEIAAKYGLTYDDMVSHRRTRDFAWPRQHAYWEVKRRCHHLSLPQIGKAFGGRDHTTILHGVRAHEQRMAEGVA